MVVFGACSPAATTAPGSAAPSIATPSSASSAGASASAAATTGRWGMTAEEEAAWKDIEAKADTEGTVTYYSVGSVPADKVELLNTAFAKDYPNIKIEYLPVGNNAAIVGKVTTEQESKTYVADVADFSLGNGLRLPPEFFEDFVTPASQDPTANMAFDPVGVSGGRSVENLMMAQYFGFWYNTELVPAADAPQTYMDLTDPKWKGKMVYRQPWVTGGGNHTFVWASQQYGDPWIEGMKAQELSFQADQDAALLSVARGEFSIGIGLTGRQATDLIDQGLPLSVVWPEDLSVRVTNGLVVMTGAPHPNAAKVFANWMLTQGGQELWAELGQFPVNLNVPPKSDWQKDFARSKVKGENLLGGAELQAAIDKAKAAFAP
jgi:iron(III) transport system substrate-binding protein